MVRKVTVITVGVIINLISVPSLAIGMAFMFIGIAEGLLLIASAYVNIAITHHYIFRHRENITTQQVTDHE